jgi:hypothetical protein
VASPTVLNLATIAVLEVVRPNTCRLCHGVGYVGIKACHSCDGAMFKPLSSRQVAKAIGVDESHYRRCWGERYVSVLLHVQAFDSEVRRAFRLSDQEDCNHCVEA